MITKIGGGSSFTAALRCSGPFPFRWFVRSRDVALWRPAETLAIVVAIMGRRLIAIVSLCLFSFVSFGVFAPVVMAQQPEEVERARAQFQRAIELEQAGDYAGALKLFRRVGQVKMTPQVRYHIATCEENLGKMVAALGGYRLALQRSEGMHPGFIQEVKQSIAYLEERIPRLLVRRGQGAEAAAIELDGVELGDKSIGSKIPLDPGPHTVQAMAPGYKDYSQTVMLAEGEVEELTLELEPEKRSEPERPAPEPPPQQDPEPPKGYGFAPFITGGAGIAVAATGGILLGVSQGRVARAKELCGGTTMCEHLGDTDPEAWNEVRDLQRTARNLEMAGWVTGGVGIAAICAGTALYFLDPARGQEQTSLEVQAAAPGADAGLSLLGRF